MPRVDELIDKFGKAKYISTLDLLRGYWQVSVEKQAKKKTAFATPFGLYQFIRMPFGLQGAPATFQRMIDKLLDGLGNFANACLDDLVIYSSTWEEHLQHLPVIFQRLEEAGLTIKKCQLGMTQCIYLGHVVGRGQVKPEFSKIGALEKFERLKIKRDVRTFLGMVRYYSAPRHLVPKTILVRCVCIQ